MKSASGISRRKFIGHTLKAGFLGALGTLGYASVIEPNWLRVVSYDLQSKKWPSGKPPLKIAIAADLHVGCPSVTLSTLENIVKQLNAMNADCILLLGDFVIQGVLLGKQVQAEPIAEILAGLSAPLGVYSVLGNHDWWLDGHAIWAALEKAGIKVLENDAVLVERAKDDKFWIAGLADDTTRNPDIDVTLKKVVTDDPVILMTHDPATFLNTSQKPVVTLAGHTHGGQLAAPFWGAIVIPGKAPLRYACGHITENNCDLIVSCGIGTSVLPVRFNRRPELISLTISS